MAIIDGCPGIVITVEVAGQDLPEYVNVDEARSWTISNAYVEALSNAEFAIAVRFDPAHFPYQQDHIELELVLGAIRARRRQDQYQIRDKPRTRRGRFREPGGWRDRALGRATEEEGFHRPLP